MRTHANSPHTRYGTAYAKVQYSTYRADVSFAHILEQQQLGKARVGGMASFDVRFQQVGRAQVVQ